MIKLNKSIMRDLEYVLGSLTAVFNEGSTEFYMFAIHKNNREIARGMFTNDHTRHESRNEFDYVYSRSTNQIIKI